MDVFDEMRLAIGATAVDRLGEVAAAVWQAYGAGGLSDEQAEQLDGLLAARRRIAQAVPTRALTLAAACAQVVPAAAPAPDGQGTVPARAHPRTGSRPRTPESKARRRRWAASGYLPPSLSEAFTPGEQAVMAVVGKHIAARGVCNLAMGHIAALAGVSITTAKRAMRQAVLVGLVTIELRRVTGFRNDTNLVRIASAAWAAWLRLRLRLPRSARPDLVGGGQLAAGTGVRVPSKGRERLGNLSHRPIARPDRTTRPAARGAVA